MARIVKHTHDIETYKKKLEDSYKEVVNELDGCEATLREAKSYYVNPDEVGSDDIEFVRVINSDDLKIACNSMKQVLDNIKVKFTKKD